MMRVKYLLLFSLNFITLITFAQNDQPPSLNVGDQAPPLRLSSWIKGTPVQKFEKGKVYVLEFWATWCGPCIAAMPHLSALAKEYKDRVIFLGIDIHEKQSTSLNKIKSFVDSMGNKMDYNVAVGNSNLVASYFDSSGTSGIPTTFVVDSEGRLVWIGHPNDLAGILKKIFNNNFNIQEELAKRKFNNYLRNSDYQANLVLYKYLGKYYNHDDLGKPDSGLILINNYLIKQPKLKYAPFFVLYTFRFLLETNPHKAYEYGKEALVNPSYDDIPYHFIWGAIERDSQIFSFPAEIYKLGAETYQARINAFPESIVPEFYTKMAEWYWIINDKFKAIEAQQKAIETFQKARDFSIKKMALLTECLEQYKKM